MIDDGSTDKSLEIARKYADEDPRFKLIASEHVGFPEAKNIGLRNAKGDYIIFLDSDDCAYSNWLMILYELCEITGADISTCLYDEFMEGKKEKAEEEEITNLYKTFIPIQEYSFLKMNLLFQYGCTSYMWNKLIRKELYEGIYFVDQIALSDISTMYKIFDKANKVIQVQLPLIHYRRHLDSMGIHSVNKLGTLDYYIFRINVLKEMISFVWNKYPQSRRIIQIILNKDLNRFRQILGDDDFNKYIYTDDLKIMLASPTIPYSNSVYNIKKRD